MSEKWGEGANLQRVAILLDGGECQPPVPAQLLVRELDLAAVDPNRGAHDGRILVLAALPAGDGGATGARRVLEQVGLVKDLGDRGVHSARHVLEVVRHAGTAVWMRD